METIYFDNNATTKVSPEVLEAMMPFFSDLYGNPSSLHTFGGQVAKYIDTARQQVADLLGASRPSEIIFTSCGTEGNNTAIRSALKIAPKKKHIITTKVEHPAVLNLCKTLEKEGYETTYLSVNREGNLNLDEFRSAIKDNTAVVSVMWANNETGVIFPVKKIADICAEKKIPFHVDAVQAPGKVDIDLSKIPITYLTISGHKLHAPKGVGALFIRRGTTFHPLLIGGSHEQNRRAGTHNVASIVALGKASEIAKKDIKIEREKVFALRNRLEENILKKIPRSFVNGGREERLPNTTNISFESIEGEAILLMLNEFGICASSGSACSSGSLEPSHVLMAMGVPFTRAHGSVRLSLGKYNTEKEVDFVVEKLQEIVAKLRALSPVP